jgi:hypothetical protein
MAESLVRFDTSKGKLYIEIGEGKEKLTLEPIAFGTFSVLTATDWWTADESGPAVPTEVQQKMKKTLLASCVDETL